MANVQTPPVGFPLSGHVNISMIDPKERLDHQILDWRENTGD
jgi:hypothetical protein